jgi:hypothetical protein
MKILYALWICFLTSICSLAQYSDPNFSKPDTGYGCDGKPSVGLVSFINANYPARLGF